jgi:hypothetical protein
LYFGPKSHKEVATILENKNKNEQNKWFEQMRIEGMYKYNTDNIDKLSDEQMMRERKPKKKDEVRMCENCKCFFSHRTFYAHRKNCIDSIPIKKDAIQPLLVHKDPEFVKEILNNFRDGPVGNFIRENKTIQLIGYKHFCSRKVDVSKSKEVKREIMMEMRELTRLFLRFKEFMDDDCILEDMYDRKNLNILVDAINKLCECEDTQGEKHGLKVNLNGIFQKSIKTLKRHYTGVCEDEKHKEIKKFAEAYSDRTPEFLAKARYATDKNSLKKARLPKNLPDKYQLAKLRTFIHGEITNIVSNFTIKDYSWLRSLVVARLTLYNARRGEEGCRILVDEWNDAMNDVWTPSECVDNIEDPAEKFLVGQYKLVYMAGKGKKCVPVLIPLDLLEAVNILLENRTNFNISPDNPFLFATKSSKYACSGWHAVSDVCREAKVSINATSNRHRISTVFASLDMSDNDRRIFFDHMGHEENINKENYQCPPGVRTVKVMGAFLRNLEQQEGMYLKIYSVVLMKM